MSRYSRRIRSPVNDDDRFTILHPDACSVIDHHSDNKLLFSPKYVREISFCVARPDVKKGVLNSSCYNVIFLPPLFISAEQMRILSSILYSYTITMVVLLLLVTLLLKLATPELAADFFFKKMIE